ncbi:MAG: 4-hydroxy-tetrahydrodipicolinate reductase [Micrococcales bacterium]
MTISVAVVGASGRMGTLALELIEASQHFRLHSALDSKSDLKEVLGADVIFEVTKFEVSEKVVDFAIANDMNIVVGTSGWSATALAAVDKKLQGSKASVTIVPNFSIGSALATKFAAESAKYFENIEIVETHHAGKIDSPSGTAVRTAELIAEARGETPLVPGVGQPARGQIVAGVPVHSLRLHNGVTKQEVNLAGSNEMLTLSHEVSSINAYVNGMISTIQFAAKANGLTVGLQAVLGL